MPRTAWPIIDTKFLFVIEQKSMKQSKEDMELENGHAQLILPFWQQGK
jgi:hypothetical protein